MSPGVGPDTARRLLTAFGSPQAVFDQSSGTLRQMGSDKLARAIQTPPPALAAQLRTTVEWLQAGEDRCVVALGDPGYPTALLDIEDPPLMLYMLGSLCNPAQPAINTIAKSLAIVGSRNPTPQGESNAREFAKAFGRAGICIVSGLALGVDGAAHDGALQGGGQTIAVVGTGLDRVYPKKHLVLAHRIAQQGLIISEFAIGVPPLTANFPRRNRLISGLTRGTLVVEAALKSGSLITARLAVEQGKDVFAIPGSIHSPQSRGCHALIKQGAKLVELAQDVLEELNWAAADPSRGTVAGDLHGASIDSPADPALRSLLATLGFDAVSLDTLQARTGLETARLQAQLLELELGGQLARLPGGLFQRLVVA